MRAAGASWYAGSHPGADPNLGPVTEGDNDDVTDIVLDGGPLTREEVLAVARRRATVSLGDGAVEGMNRAGRVIDDASAARRVVYGVTTGFGALATTSIEPERVDERDHLEPEDAADRRYEERDAHGRTLPPPRRPRLGMTGLAAEDPNRCEILADRGDLDRWPPCSGAAAPGCRVPARGGAAAAETPPWTPRSPRS